MERNEFLSKLGIGIVAVCAGCALSSCGSGIKADDPSPQNNGQNGALLTADLTTELTTVGQPKVSNGIILVRVASGNLASSFTAVQVACTHQGTPINYNTSQGIFICPLHGSQFSTSGSVLQGPAAQALKKYNVSITGNILTVSA